MNLYGNLDAEKAMAGMLYGVNPNTIVTFKGKETINFGKGVFLNGSKDAVLNGKHNNKATIDLSAYTTASKDIVLTINGVAISATTSGTIATDVAGIIEDINDDVEKVTATAGTGADAGKIFLVSDDDSEIEVNLVYDGSDVTSSKVTQSTDAVYAGVSVFHQDAFINSLGCYAAQEAVAVMEKGYIWVVLADNVTPAIEANAYVTPEGTFTTESSGNTLVGKFKSGKETGSNSDSLALVSLD
jgi:hypothetical protein